MTPRQETFAKAMALGTFSQLGAYKIAGYTICEHSRANASRLASNDNVRAGIERFKREFSQMSQVSRDSISAKLDEAFQLARRLDQPDTMRKCAMDEANLHGMVVTKSEAGKPGDFAKTSEERIESVAKLLDTLEHTGKVLPLKRA